MNGRRLAPLEARDGTSGKYLHLPVLPRTSRSRLHQRYVRHEIRVRLQLYKYIEVYTSFLESVRRITDNQVPDLTLLSLLTCDSMFIKLVDEGHLLMVQLRELLKVDRLARQFLYQTPKTAD